MPKVDKFTATVRPNLVTFNADVYARVRTIPEGKVVSYGAIARELSFPTHSRLVGQALKLLPPSLSSPILPPPPIPLHLTAVELEEYLEPAPMPNPLFVPWHRVVNSQGVISPRDNRAGMGRQVEWLRNEGIVVNTDGVLEGGGKVKMRDVEWDWS